MPVDQKNVVRVLMVQRDRLFAYIWSIVGDVHLAEDVIQEVSLVAAEKGGEVANERALVVWLRTTARHKCLEAIRADRRAPLSLASQTLDLLDAQWARQDEVDTATMLAALDDCLRQLTPRTQRLVRMRYVENLGASHIAGVLHRKTAAVYQALTRAHRALGDCMRQQLAGQISETHDG